MPPKRPARKTLHSAFIHSLPPKLTLDKLTPEHLRRTYGLAPCLPGDLLELPQCPARWNGVEGGEMAEDDDDEIEIVEPVGTSRKGKGKGKPAKGGKCSLEGCVGNPRCANWLGQEKWEDEDKSLKPFLRGLVDPTSVRDPELPVGLKNLGATCYVNSLLQVWFQDETFRSGVYACQPPSLGDVDSSPLFQLQLLFSFLQTARQAVYNPVTLVSALKLDTGEQQDAQEFSKLFMNLLDQQFKKQNLLDDRVGGVKVKRLVEEQFEGQVVYGIECSVCHHRSERQTKFSELEVTLIKDCKLEDRIRESLKEELMTGDNQYHCEGCSAKRDARRFTLLPHLPPVLHFSLMRFVFSAVTYERSKSNHAISYPLKLDMGQFLSRDAQGGTQEAWYDLKGVLMHKGQSAHHGHYVAQVHDARRKKWFLFDDETVSPIDDLNAPDRYDEEESEVLSAKRLKARAKVGFVRSKNGDLLPKSKDAYMLIYTRREMDPDQPQREEPVPQPLAEMRVEQLDEQHESLVKEYATHSTEMRCEFDRLREEKREVYRTWDVLPDEEGFLVSKDELKRWMREGLVPPKKIEEVKSTSEEDIKLDDASPPTSTIVPADSFPVESLPVVSSTSADEVKVLDPSDEMDLDAKKITLIDNQGLVCPHGKANPVKAEHFKRIGKRGVEALLKLGVTIEPALELPDALCRECVWGMVAETTYSSSHQQRVKEISSVLHDGEQTTYLSRIWYNDWIKTNPKMHVTNSIADPHPSSGSFARDVLCEHGNLQPEPKKRILISAEATALLESIFPDWQAVSTSTDSCDICERTFVDYKANTHELKRLAAEEKLAFKSFDQQTRLIGSQLLLVRGKDHYIIPKAFPREWVKWQRSKGDPKNPRPLPIDNSQFLCEHQKVLVNIKSEVDNPVKIDVTSEKDWKSLQKRYDAGPQIKIWEDELSGMVKTFPEICEECVDRERKSFDSTELKIKFLSAADFDASGARTQEIRTSPEVEIMSSTKKRFSSASTLVTPTRSSKRIKQGPQMRANKKMQRIEMSKGDTIRDLKIKIAERLSIPTIYQKLYYNLKELDSAETVAELGLCGGDVVELFEMKMSDDEVDLSKLDDGIERKERRNGKKGREEGFGGTGLFGYEEMNGGGCGAEGTSEVEMGFELRRDGGKESSSGTGTGTEMIEEEMDDHVNCPQCTFAQSLSNEACEVCDSAL